MSGTEMKATHAETNAEVLEVVILAYRGMTLLDAIGPNEVLSNSGRFNVSFVSKDGLEVANDHENLRLSGLRSIDEVHSADILLIPGGPGDVAVMEDEEVIRWIIEVDETTRYTTSVCTGSLILAKTGLLKGRKACSYWAYLPSLAELGAIPVRRRFVSDGKYITSSGVSAGIDMALFLVRKVAGRDHTREMQFGIEYFPNRYDLVSTYTLPKPLLERFASRARKVIDGSRARIKKGARR